MLESLQGRLIFGRTTGVRPLQPGPHAGRYRVHAHRLARPDGAVLEGWSSTPLDGPAAGALLYFGGRNENVAWAADMASFNPGWAVHAFNYRGFGGSTGRASERRAKADARALLDVVTARLPCAELAVAGRSLGTAVALAVAAEARPRRLVLMSPFESVPAVLRSRPFGRVGASLVTQRFDCGALAALHAGDTLVLLAEDDDSVLHAQSRRLCDRLPCRPSPHVIAGTTHRTLPRSGGAQRAIAAFLAGPRTLASMGHADTRGACRAPDVAR
jgi:pimeloyl-ACP methyl ester carboxylesterase